MTTEPPSQVLLIHDDDPFDRQPLCTYLQQNGFALEQTSNAQAALENLQVDSPRLLLCALASEQVEPLLQKLSEKAPHLPAIALLKNDCAADMAQALRCGAWDVLLESETHPEQIAAALQRVLARTQAQLENEVGRRTRELTKHIEEMTRFNHMAVGRERRIIELKRQINTLLEELGREPKYRSPELIEESAEYTD